jgi:signal transduction histidine kinase
VLGFAGLLATGDIPESERET